METTIEKKRTRTETVFENPVFVIIDDYKIRLCNVYLYDDMGTAFRGQLKLFDNEAPFYFTFDRRHMHYLKIKGYRDSYFLQNLFRLKYDRYGKMFLSCNPDYPDTMLKYHPIGGYIDGILDKTKGMNDLRSLVVKKKTNPYIFSGFRHIKNKLSLIGEAIEIIKL